MIDDYVIGVAGIIGIIIGYFVNTGVEKYKSKLEIKNYKIKLNLTSKRDAYQKFSETMREIQTLNDSICNAKSHEQKNILISDRNKLFTQLTKINKSPYMDDEEIHYFYSKMNEYTANINTEMIMHFNLKQQSSTYLSNAYTALDNAGELCNRVDDHIQKVILKELEHDEIKI